MNDTSQRGARITPSDWYLGACVVFVLLVVSLLVWVGMGELRRGVGTIGWTDCRCTITSNSYSDGISEGDDLLIGVVYEWEGKSYETVRQLQGAAEELEHMAELFLRVGDQVEAKVDPADPRRVMIEYEYSGFRAALLTVTILAALLAVSVIGAPAWIRARNSARWRGAQRILGLFGGLAASVVILAFCGTATIRAICDVPRVGGTLLWDGVDATIVTCRVDKYRKVRSWDYTSHLEYKYRVDDSEYMGCKWSLSDEESGTRIDKRDALEDMAPDDEVTCYVNPEDPGEAILHRGVWFLLAGLLVLPIILVFAGLGVRLFLRELVELRSSRSTG